jgi:hypothetical protein
MRTDLKNHWSLAQDLKTDLFYTIDEKGSAGYPFREA